MKRLANESVLEDWVVEHPRHVTGLEHSYTVGRQVEMPDGSRLDVLMIAYQDCWMPPMHCVVEVKATRAGTKALTQLLGYVGNLYAVLQDDDILHRPQVAGILAAPAFSDRLIMASRACRIMLCRLSVEIGAEIIARDPKAVSRERQAALRSELQAMRKDLRRPEPDDDPWDDAKWWVEDNDVQVSVRRGRLHIRPSASWAVDSLRRGSVHPEYIKRYVQLNYASANTALCLPKPESENGFPVTPVGT